MTTSQSDTLIAALAERLDTAWRTRTPLPPIAESDGVTSVETAYAIQTRWTHMRLACGEKVVGRKIGRLESEKGRENTTYIANDVTGDNRYSTVPSYTRRRLP